MCETCGCGDPELVPVDVHESLFAKNDLRAAHNREHFAAGGVVTINLMGSPGSGKTALLEATAAAPQFDYRLSAVSGDLATDRDAARLARAGIPSRAITTGNACHLDAAMVHHALHNDSLRESVYGSDFFFIENVGNLVCPAVYDLGQTVNVVALAVTEGEDKPLKYPVMFQRTDLVVLTKVDLLPHLPGYSVDALREALERVAPNPQLMPVASTTGVGLRAWLDWLVALRRPGARVAHNDGHRHSHGASG